MDQLASPPPQAIQAISISLTTKTSSTQRNMDDTIQGAIREVVQGIVEKIELMRSQPEYVAARGAAEMAWRANILDKSIEISNKGDSC